MIATPGSTARLEVVYRTGPGALIDPPDPLLASLVRPDNTHALDAVVPVRDALGVYHVDYDVPGDAPIGSWVINWQATIDGVLVEGSEILDVVPSESLPRFAATLEGVEAYLPHLKPIADTDKLDPASVIVFLAEVGGTVAVRVDPLLRQVDALADTGAIAVADRDALYDTARRLTELGAAAYTQDAAFPELAATGETDTRYGATLWGRFLTGLDNLAAAATAAVAAAQDDTPASPVGPSGSFPEPLFVRDRPW